MIVDDWLFTSLGAAIHVVETVAVVADLYLGYEWARRAAGDTTTFASLQRQYGRGIA
jgi:hypothetical protein